MPDIVGLNIGDLSPDRCSAQSPQNGAQCVLPAGHDGPHEASGSGDGAPPACPDCGGPMAEFRVDAPTEEMAERVFVAYYATRNIPIELLTEVLNQTKHLHVAEGGTCDS